MFYLSKLIYDYHENDDFDILFKETIHNYLLRINTEHENGIHEPIFINIKNSLLFLSNNYSNSYIYNFIENESTDIQCGIIISYNKIIIVFKGTDSLIDCYYDLKFIKRNIDLNDIQIHKGFFDQLISIYDELIDNINKLLTINPSYMIYITGHSAGGAQGTIFAYLLSKKYLNKIIKLITFGCPKVGNYEWFEDFNTMKNIIYYRISNEGDIITKIPNYNYYHVGINIHLTHQNVHILKNNICCSKEYCEKECCINYDSGSENECILSNIISKINYLNIFNHNINNYLINIINKQEIIEDMCSKRQISFM
jgi:hypothetical protein